MSRSLRIRFITGRIVWPLPDGIALRQYAVLRGLSRLGEVDMLCRVPPDGSESVPRDWSELCQCVVAQPDPLLMQMPTGWPRARKAIQLLTQITGRPPSAAAFPRRLHLPETRDLLDAEYDVTWVVRLGNFWRFGLTGGDRHVLDLDDVKHREYLRETHRRDFSLRNRIVRVIEGRAWRRAELGVLSRVGRVVVCSEADRLYLARPNVVAVHNAIHVDPHESFAPGVPGRMIFVGNMSFEPNVDGVVYFVRDVLPQILVANSHAHLWIVGRDPAPAVQRLHDGCSVHVLGAVPDVKPLLAQASLSVVPLRMGSGTRLKIVESLAAQKPVVSTTIGAEGLELADGLHIDIADEPSEFARCCLRLLSDPAAAQSRAESGHRQVARLYSWDYAELQVRQIVAGL